MDDFDFYCFTDMKYVEQQRTNWCWAACAQQMIKGLNVTNAIKELQCDIATHYSQKYSKYKGRADTDCCNAYNGEVCNLPLKNDDFETLFKELGFECTPIDDPRRRLSDYNFIRSTLEEDSLIILRTKGNNPHYVLVTGYGCNGRCKYILITDPDSSEGETYYSITRFPQRSILEKAWKITISNKNNTERYLKEDTVAKEYYSKLNELLINLDKHNINLQFNIWKGIPSGEIIMEKLLGSARLKGSLIESYALTPKSLLNECPTYQKCDVITADILEKTYKMILEDHLFHQNISYNYLQDFEISFVTVKKEDTFQSKVVTAPENYSLPKDWANTKQLEQVISEQ